MSIRILEEGTMNHSRIPSLGSVALATSILFALTGCSREPEPEPTLAGEGEECVIDGDCEQGLSCRNQVCITSNVPDMTGGGDDMDNPDDDMTSSNNQTTVEDEDYVISYVLEKGSGDEKGRKFLWAVDTATGAQTQVTTTSSHCELGCWLSKDLSYFVYIRPSSQGVAAFDVYATSVEDLQAQGDGSVIAESVERVLFKGDMVTYMRDNGSGKTAFYLELGATQEQTIGELSVKGDSRETQDSWHISSTAGKAVTFSPSLQSLSIRVADIGSSITSADQIHVIDGSNYQETGGSYFGSNIPVAFSPDGRYMALLTTAPNNYNTCEGNGDCDAAKGRHCGEDKLCTAREVTVRTFDLMALDEISDGNGDGAECTSDSECSSAHECYIPSDFQLDLARCVPRRIVLGLPNTPTQPRVGNVPSREGCELTQEIDGYEYTDVRPPLVFGPDNNLYVTAARECGGRGGEINMGDTDILRISPNGGMIDVVSGNMGENFDAEKCYDLANRDYTIPGCVIYIRNAMLSPNGQELAFLGTNLDVTDVSKAASTLDVWSVLSNGENREWLGRNDLFDEVLRLDVHPKP